jgi:fluoroacetyl-CoA thioesterase
MFDLRNILSIGQNSMIRHVVQNSDTFSNYSKDLNELLATPACVGMAIKASVETVDQYLPEGFVSIGYSTEFTHTAPTSLGMTITVKSSIIELTDHEVILKIEVWDDQGEVGHGTHKRVVVNHEALVKKARQRTRFLTNRTL